MQDKVSSIVKGGEIEPVQKSSVGSKRVLEGQTSMARVMTSDERPQGYKKGAPPSWLEVGGLFGREHSKRRAYVKSDKAID